MGSLKYLQKNLIVRPITIFFKYTYWGLGGRDEEVFGAFVLRWQLFISTDFMRLFVIR